MDVSAYGIEENELAVRGLRTTHVDIQRNPRCAARAALVASRKVSVSMGVLRCWAVTELVAGCYREVLQIAPGLNDIRRDADRIKLLTEERHVAVGRVDDGPQSGIDRSRRLVNQEPGILVEGHPTPCFSLPCVETSIASRPHPLWRARESLQATTRQLDS